MRTGHLKIFLTLLVLCSTAVVANPLDEAARLLEEENMNRLHAQQIRPGVIIDAFQTDGCSGGLSDSWKTLARIWPELARAVGEEPPWESCCIAHDRDYWRGESIGGFEARLQSDQRLRQCVERTGGEQSAAIADRVGIARTEIVEVFNLAAELMFRAVRIGGGPCSGLAWRWGYGWPPCSHEVEPANNNLDLVAIPRTF